MNYDNDIIRILHEAGRDGLSVRKIATHVYNANNGFFDTHDFEEVVRCVYSYLLRNSKKQGSAIERTGRRGVYRLNTAAVRDGQPMLRFLDRQDDTPPETPAPDLSLSLFD